MENVYLGEFIMGLNQYILVEVDGSFELRHGKKSTKTFSTKDEARTFAKAEYTEYAKENNIIVVDNNKKGSRIPRNEEELKAAYK